MDSEAAKLSSAIAQFSTKFINELSGASSTVSSPLSAELLLALLTLGTSGQSHTELLTALNLPSDDYIRSAFTTVSKSLKSAKGITFNVANKLYIKEGDYNLVAKFQEDAEKVFDAEIEKINFDDGELACSQINQWVEKKTNDKIKKLLSGDSVNTNTRLVLVNALYFKGSWKKKFNVAATRDLPFHLDAQRTTDLPTMCMKHKFMYGENQELDAKFLELPYEGDEASLLVVLPNQVDGLSALVAKLAAGVDLMAATKRMFLTEVELRLPKFKIETEIDLAELLPKVGIKAIFNKANSGLTGLLDNNEALFVSKAVQKAFIEVNEEGAEAAAATAFGVMMCSAMIEPEPTNFFVDRPFLSSILVGRVPAFYTAYRGHTN